MPGSSGATGSGTAEGGGARPPLAPVFAQYPIEVRSAEGVWLHTRTGGRVLDLYGGHAVVALGYGHPRWLAALQAQAGAVAFQTNAVAMAVRERAAERLVRFAGLDLDTVFFVNSGAEANEAALRLACKLTGRGRVVAVAHGFHGRTAAAGAVTYGAAGGWYGFPRAPFDVHFLPRPPAPASAGQPGAGLQPALRAAIESGIDAHTAAVIVEPVQGLAGAFDLGAPYLAALRHRCDAVGALLIFDEVQCGVGRCGQPFAARLYGVTPDMISAAKALGSGFPCAALLMSRRVARELKIGDLGTTFGGGPLACAVMEAVIGVIEEGDLLANVRRLAELIRVRCQVGPVCAVQGEGFLLGLRTTPSAKAVQQALLARGILAGTASDPHVLRLLPPYVLEEAHVEMLRETLLALDMPSGESGGASA